MMKVKPQVVRRSRLPVEGSFCKYPHRSCTQPRLDGHDFCSRHILEDKNGAYKQCSFISNKSGKRCPNAAPKADKKEGYCLDHGRRSAMLRHRAARKRKPTETPETLLEQIEHYGSKTEEHGARDKRSRHPMETLSSRVIDYASSTDSDTESALVDQAWPGDGDSDAESIDSEQEDPLKHAGVYTAEEVALITRDKLIRLQSLYIDQFKRLQHSMREKRRKYLHTVRAERHTLGSVHAAKEDPEQRETYEQLVAMKRYHCRFGKEALLHRQSKERRIAVSEGPNYRAPVYPKCMHTQDGLRCSARTVPLSKHCLHHILSDGHQVLYRSCSYGGGLCSRPALALRDPPQCVLHRGLPPPVLANDDQQKDDEGERVQPSGAAGLVLDVMHQDVPSRPTPTTSNTPAAITPNTRAAGAPTAPTTAASTPTTAASAPPGPTTAASAPPGPTTAARASRPTPDPPPHSTIPFNSGTVTNVIKSNYKADI